jgi:PPOX class F420-dependent enzyme/OxyR family protein
MFFYVGGMNLMKSTKYKNVLKNNKVALVIDDLKSVDPWDPRGMKIYGTADIWIALAILILNIYVKVDIWIALAILILNISE